MIYDSRKTRSLYRFIVGNSKEPLSAFIRSILESGGKIGYVLAENIYMSDEGQTAANKTHILDHSSSLLRRCGKEEILDEDGYPWDYLCVWMPE